ncbi:hypothetical protein LTS18_006687 [Coniosporium uncinatum]|uniref:Uncharacterized protein n=1 Tax=Coniosporium uncinatum TaxID=93489 RepID=A0ACC3D3E9_9PEZI|nr:hypothetical protein LTS18_006687 [Coniosporium uncinatum]
MRCNGQAINRQEAWHLYQPKPSSTHKPTNGTENECRVERHDIFDNVEKESDNVSSSPVGNQLPQAKRIQLESVEAFMDVLACGQPVIIGGVNLGSCTNTWDAEYLKERLGAQRPVIVHSSSSVHMDFQKKNFSYVKQPFGEFVERAGRGEHVYLRALSSNQPSKSSTSLKADFPQVAGHFSLPPEMQFAAENEHSSVLRISGQVTMWLHYDVMANILCQIRGSKSIVLFPPSDIHRLGFPAGETTSTLSPLTDRKTIARTSPIEAVLLPGDVLFIPPCWPHVTAPNGPDMSVAVNVFFRSLINGYSTGKDVYGNRDLEMYQNGRREIEKIAKAIHDDTKEDATAWKEALGGAIERRKVLSDSTKGAKEANRIVKSAEGLPRDIGQFYLDRLAEEVRQLS